MPSILANSVSSLPRPTFLPGWIGVPRWRTRIEPPVTSWPPKRLTPEALGVRVAAVAGTAAALLVCHGRSPRATIDAVDADLGELLPVTVACGGTACSRFFLKMITFGPRSGSTMVADDPGRRNRLAEARARPRRRPGARRRTRPRALLSAATARRADTSPGRDPVLLAAVGDDGVHETPPVRRRTSSIASVRRFLQVASTTARPAQRPAGGGWAVASGNVRFPPIPGPPIPVPPIPVPPIPVPPIPVPPIPCRPSPCRPSGASCRVPVPPVPVAPVPVPPVPVLPVPVPPVPCRPVPCRAGPCNGRDRGDELPLAVGERAVEVAERLALVGRVAGNPDERACRPSGCSLDHLHVRPLRCPDLAGPSSLRSRVRRSRRWSPSVPSSSRSLAGVLELALARLARAR